MNMVAFTVHRYRTPRSKVTDEAMVVFDTVENRNMVKAAAPILGGKTGKTGVRIHVP